MDATAGERVLILSAGVGSGHNSAAAALRGVCAARPDVAEVEVLDVLDVSSSLYRDLLEKGYFALVAEAPWLVGWGYDRSDQPFWRRGPIDPWTRLNSIPTLRRIRRFRPTVVICTHFLPAQLVASLLARNALPARTAIVTTDYDFQGLWLAGAFHELFLAREEARVLLGGLGVPGDRVTATGIPVRAPAPTAGERAVDAPRRLLVSAGASGGDYAADIVRQLAAMTTPFRATVVCGRNAELRQGIEALVGGDARFEVLGFTDRMPQLMREADLFVGKPGGLSASECMAAGLPMLLVNPIPGQEVRNGDYLIEEGAAVRCHSPMTIGWKVEQLLRDPGRLDRMAERALAVGEPDAAGRIVERVLGTSRFPLVISRAAQRSLLLRSSRRAEPRDGGTIVIADAETGRSAAIVGDREFDELHSWHGDGDGALVLDRDAAERIDRSWGVGRLAAAVLGDHERMRLVAVARSPD